MNQQTKTGQALDTVRLEMNWFSELWPFIIALIVLIFVLFILWLGVRWGDDEDSCRAQGGEWLVTYNTCVKKEGENSQ